MPRVLYPYNTINSIYKKAFVSSYIFGALKTAPYTISAIIYPQYVVKGVKMQTVAIRDLKNNPSNMTKYLENNETVFITKHSKPIGITLPLNDDTLSIGLKKVVAIEQYKNGLISLGKMAEFLEIKKTEAMSLLNRLGIDWLDYSKEELDKQSNIAKKYAKK